VATVAVFDLDGTLTHHDTLVPWWWRLFWQPPALGVMARWAFRMRALARAVHSLLHYLIRRDRGQLKASLLYAVLSPWSASQVAALAEHYVASLDASRFNAALVERLQQHQALGHRTILMSASVDCYVPLIAKRLRFDECICTTLEWRQGALSGALAGENVRGLVKLEHLKALQQRFAGATFYAYGNAGSDLPHLRAVEHAFLVNASARDRRAAQRDHIATHLGAPLS